MAKKKKKKSQEKSITWVVTGVVIVVAVMGWACLASSYAGAHAPIIEEIDMPTRIPRRGAAFVMAIVGVGKFIYNAFEQIPNFPWVIGWHFTNRIGLLIGIIVVEVVVIGGGMAMKSLERKLAEPYKPKRE